MFHLPTLNHPARALIDVEHVAKVLHPDNRGSTPPVWLARKSAEAVFNSNPAARRVAMIVCRYDTGEYWLVSFGRKGGWKKVWNFGTGA